MKNHSSRTPQKITQWNRTGSSWETWSLTAWKSLSPRRKAQAVRTYRGWRGLSSDLSGINNVHTIEPRSPTKGRDWALFWKLRKKTQSALKTAHWNYLNTLFEEDGGSNRGLWRYLKSTRKDTCWVSTLVSDGRIASDAQDKADMLNNQFSSVFTRGDRLNLPPKVKSSYPKMPRITVSSAGVLKLLSQLNARKASGADNIPAVFLKTCVWELATMLAFIMQQSLTTRRIPSDWKKALVMPVFKKGDKSKPENYRLV